MNKIFGYARVSTLAQNLDTQLDVLPKESCNEIFQNKITGLRTATADRNRSALEQLIAQLRPDDTVMVARFFRLGRGRDHLISLLGEFTAKGIHYLGVDSATPAGQLEMDLPKMILVDLYLPSAEQGLGVLHAIKSHPHYKPVTTLILSWSNRFEDITQVFNYSADGYLVKPTNYQDWIAELSLLDNYYQRE